MYLSFLRLYTSYNRSVIINFKITMNNYEYEYYILIKNKIKNYFKKI